MPPQAMRCTPARRVLLGRRHLLGRPAPPPNRHPRPRSRRTTGDSRRAAARTQIRQKSDPHARQFTVLTPAMIRPAAAIGGEGGGAPPPLLDPDFTVGNNVKLTEATIDFGNF